MNDCKCASRNFSGQRGNRGGGGSGMEGRALDKYFVKNTRKLGSFFPKSGRGKRQRRIFKGPVSGLR